MNSVELVLSVCKERNIPIAKLERECGFANGYVKRLRRGTFPSDRAQIVADYLEIPLNYLLTGEKEPGYYLNPETAKIAQELFDDPNFRILFDAARDSKPEDLQAAANWLRRLKETNPDEV